MRLTFFILSKKRRTEWWRWRALHPRLESKGKIFYKRVFFGFSSDSKWERNKTLKSKVFLCSRLTRQDNRSVMPNILTPIRAY